MAAPIADIYHGHDLTGLAAAVAAADRHNGATVVYDSHEVFLEAGSNARRPAWAKRILARLELRWAGDVAALVTVNQALGELLGPSLGIRRVVVVHNAPPRYDPPANPPDRIRKATRIAADEPVALYHGAFSADRGLLELVAAWPLVGLDEAHLVFLGYGDLRAELEALASGPMVPGRIHVLSAVPPEELADWVASADVGLMPNQPRTLNERLSTPNKLFECLAVGVPVVSSDFPERRRIIVDDPDGPLGSVCDPTDPAALAGAIRSILVLDPSARADLRGRCLRAAHDRWNWETESAGLLALYAELGAPGTMPGARASHGLVEDRVLT
jgi:glycosyltransferase involved in cell wall biosynthesis